MTTPSPARACATLLCAALAAPSPVRAQSAPPGAATDQAAAPVVVGASEVGGPITPVVIDVDVRTLPEPRDWEPGDGIKEIPRRAYPQPGYRPPAVPETPPDPLLALQPVPPLWAPDDFDVPLVNIDAQNFTGVSPPDTVGDVGPNHYVHAVNTSGGSSIRIYDKTQPVPAVLATFVLDTLPGVPPPCNSGFGDPVVLYDQLADRWLLSEFSTSGNRMCVYISQTPDPVTGGWFLYNTQAPQFPDYPKYGVWHDAYYVTTNEGSGNPIYAMDRANMLIGAVARPTQRFHTPKDLVFGFEALTPADHDGPDAPPAGAPAIMMRHKDDEGTPPPTADDFLQYWEVRINWTTPSSSTLTGPINIAVTDFSSELCGFQSFSCFGQGPSNVTPLDPLREVVMYRLAYRNFGTHEALVGNLVTDADGEGGGDPLERGGVRWFELRKSGPNPWALFQEGTFSPDTVPRWMGAIAMDGEGNIAVGYNLAGQGHFASLRYTGRLAADAPGSMRAETVLATGTAVNTGTRYGDYAQMSVDPDDDCTFWFTGEYNPAAQWRTRLGAFKFDSCGNSVPANTAVFTPSLQAPSCAPTGRSCDSGALLNGRDTIVGGAEPNQPNTIADSCADGGGGAYHERESIDRLRVRTLDGTQMSPGKTVRVEATVWAFKGPRLTDLATLDLYRADNALAPAWVHFASIPAVAGGAQTLSATFTLTAGALQAVRARFGYRNPGLLPCATGRFDDHDDMAFAVQ
jgi:hypothetical protein